jgi:hypothetical protein
MNFRTESFDFPQNEQRRCLSCDMAAGAMRECGRFGVGNTSANPDGPHEHVIVSVAGGQA